MEGEIDEITMVNTGGTGYTYKAVDHLVLVQTDSDKNGLSSQKIARVLLEQPNYKANIYILCLMNTQDVKWVDNMLKGFDKSKVNYLMFKNMKV